MLYSTAALFARPDDLPAVLADGLQALDRVHAGEWEVAALRSSIAAMAGIVGKFELAEAEATSALAMARRLNVPYVMALSLYALGLSCSESRPGAALAALDEHIAIVRAGPAVFVLARCLALAAQIRAAGGDLPHALDELRRAIDIAHGTGDRPAMAFTLARAVSVLRHGDATAAAVLSGVVSDGALARQFGVLTWERDWFQHLVEEIRTLLGTELYEQAVATGTALSYDDALAAAMEAVDRLSRP
jgi:hypothetical protein